MNIATMQGKEHAQAELARRRAFYKDKDWGRVTSDLPAGAPMYFGCIVCNAAVVVPEDWLTRPYLCKECQALKECGWLE